MRVEENLKITHLRAGLEPIQSLFVRDADTGYWHRDVRGGQVEADLDETLDQLSLLLPASPALDPISPPAAAPAPDPT